MPERKKSERRSRPVEIKAKKKKPEDHKNSGSKKKGKKPFYKSVAKKGKRKK